MRIKVRFYFGHVRTYSWLDKLRNTQGKIYGTYLGKIYGIYREYIRNIHKYIWYKIIRKRENEPNGVAAKRPPHWGATEGGTSVFFVSAYLSLYIMTMFGYSSYIPYTFHMYIYIYINYVPYIFPCVILEFVIKKLARSRSSDAGCHPNSIEQGHRDPREGPLTCQTLCKTGI